METTVLEPLGMASVLIPGSPAHSGEGSARDLSLFARELAAPRLVSSALAERARTPVLPGLDASYPVMDARPPTPSAWGWRCVATSPRTGPGRATVRGPSGTSVSPAPSSGWIRSPGARPSSWEPSPSGRSTAGRGPRWATRSWLCRRSEPRNTWPQRHRRPSSFCRYLVRGATGRPRRNRDVAISAPAHRPAATGTTWRVSAWMSITRSGFNRTSPITVSRRIRLETTPRARSSVFSPCGCPASPA